jgi:hypothetical protein
MTLSQSETPDPTRHLLSSFSYERRPDGTKLRTPVGLVEAAAGWAAAVDAGRGKDAFIGLADDETRVAPSPTVAFSRGRAVVISELLMELSARLRPGLQVGPLAVDDSPSLVAREMAAHLRSLI